MQVQFTEAGPDAHGQSYLCLSMKPGFKLDAGREQSAPDYVAWLSADEAESLLKLVQTQLVAHTQAILRERRLKQMLQIQAQLEAGRELHDKEATKGVGEAERPTPGSTARDPGNATRDATFHHQVEQLGYIIGGAICAPIFRPNRKYCAGATADLIPYIAYSDVMARQLIIRSQPSELPLSNFCNEKHKILAQYPDLEALLHDGWVLD